MVIKHVNTTNTHIRMKMNKLKCFIICIFVQLNNLPTC